MRTRGRKEYFSIGFPALTVWNEATNQRLPYARGSSAQLPFIEEYMKDINTGAHVGIKPCVHKVSRSNPTPTLVHSVSGVAPNRRVYDSYSYSVPALWGDSSNPGVTTTISQEQAFTSLCTGVLNKSMLAAVSVAELREVKSTFNELRSAGFGRKSFANKFLAFKFGVLPFISDLTDLVNGHEVIKQHINKVNRMKGLTVKEEMRVGTLTGYVSYKVPTSVSSTVTRQADWVGSCKAKVRLKYFRRYTAGDAMLASLDYYGAKILDIGWEALPNSFIYDWFFDIGGILSTLQPKFQVPCAEVISFCRVIKASCSYPVVEWDKFTGLAVTVGEVSNKHFSRDTVPISSNTLLGSGLSASKLSVAAALVLQKI